MTHIARTLSEILDNPLVAKAMDRSQPMDETVKEMLSFWEADLIERRPCPAYYEEVDGTPMYQGTDLDLFTVMMALAQQGNRVINIPRYENMRETTLRSNQIIISKQNRHGQVHGLVSNKDVHSFSVRITDYNVVELLMDGSEKVGAPRNFALVDVYGKLYDGWDTIEFRAAKQEKKFFDERGLCPLEDTLIVKNFVTPQLSRGFFGSRYLATKIVAECVSREARHYRGFAKQLRKEGVTLSEEEDAREVHYSRKGNTKSVKVPNLEAKLILPESRGAYPLFSQDFYGNLEEIEIIPDTKEEKQGVLRYAKQRADKLTYELGTAVRAPVRAVELASFLHGKPGEEEDPGWAIPETLRDFIEKPRSRTKWNTLEYAPGVKILYRLRETSTRIKAFQE